MIYFVFNGLFQLKGANARELGCNIRNHIFSPVNTSIPSLWGPAASMFGCGLYRSSLSGPNKWLYGWEQASRCPQSFLSTHFHWCPLTARVGGVTLGQITLFMVLAFVSISGTLDVSLYTWTGLLCVYFLNYHIKYPLNNIYSYVVI